jgi:UDPglucose 6-dehydrogenase
MEEETPMETLSPVAGRSALPFVTTAAPHSNGKLQIAIVGTGYVGLVTGTCLAELGNFVCCLDNDPAKIATLRRGELPFFEPQLLELVVNNYQAGRLSFSEDVASGIASSSIVFIAVGTPMSHDDSPDLSAVFEVAAAIGRHLNGRKTVVVKSTVPVDTGRMISAIIAENAAEPHDVEVASNPEFLREGSAVHDFMYPDRVIIGSDSPHAVAVLSDLYAPLKAPILTTDVRTSEMIKYAANAFLATKISFINEIANICDVTAVDVKAVACGIGYDHRIGTQFMSPGVGYGGSCFPKDVRALERTAHARGYDAALLRSVDAVNRGQIPRTLARIEKALGGPVDGKRICVLGLAFKPNTSDVREAPALRLIDLLLQGGASVTAHDPVAIEDAAERTGDRVLYFGDKYEAINDCDVVALTTEWKEYRSLNFAAVRKLMRGDLIFDGRDVFDPENVVAEGLRYIGVGRSQEPDRRSRAAYRDVARALAS